MTVGEKGGVENAPTPGTADPGNQREPDPSRKEADGADHGDGAAERSEVRDEPVQAVEGQAVEEKAEEQMKEDPALGALQAELEAAKQSAEQATARLRAVSKAYTELQAEMKAFKERMEHRAKIDSELQAFDQVRAFFDPVMNLKRSLGTQGDAESLRAGLQMVLQQFLDALAKLGLSEVPGVGHPFDPQMHEALGVQPVTDRALDGRVLTVHTTGYTVRGKVLQPAQVVIGKYEAAGEA